MQENIFIETLNLLDHFDKTIFINGAGEGIVNSITTSQGSVLINSNSGSVLVPIDDISYNFRCPYFYSFHINASIDLLIHKSIPVSEQVMSLIRMVEWHKNIVYVAASHNGMLRIRQHYANKVQKDLEDVFYCSSYISNPEEDPEALAELFQQVISVK